MMVSRGLFGWSLPHIKPLTPVSEVSEPESPSPYLDSGTGEVVQVDVEDEIDGEGEEMEPPPAAVPFSRLFACADWFDWVLMAIGSTAAAHGTALVVYSYFFAKIINLLGDYGADHVNGDELFHKFNEGSINALELLEEMNARVAEGYKGFGDVALGLRVFVEQLKSKSVTFDHYIQQLDAIDQQVTEFEPVISMLDKYVTLLESKMKSVYQVLPNEVP